VSLGPTLQIVGAACELVGIGTVAWGISETRARFTDRPSLARRAWARASRASARIFRLRRDTTVHVGAAELRMGGGNVRARATVGFGPWDEEALEERIERLRRAIESHEQQLGDLDSRFDDEERSRREADEQHERRVNEVERELTELIREAAAGGLRLETIGVSLFALGVVLQTAGSLAAS
jgi:hypothetical protein